MPEAVDVAVIGAGFTGLSAARTLAKRGAKVAVLESETIGWGASSRNGGMVLTGMKLGVNQLISTYGRERTQRMYAASLATIDCVEQIVREEAIDCDFARCGHLEVACKQKHFDDYARQAEVIAREFHHTLRVVQKHELSSEIGSSIYLRRHGRRSQRRLQSCALRRRTRPRRHEGRSRDLRARPGSNHSSETRARARRDGNSRPPAAHSGRTKSSSPPADTPAAATPALQKKLIPIGSFIITTEVLPETLAQELSPRNRMIYDSKNYLYYYRLTPDRRMLFGGRAAFFPETDQTVRQSAEILRRGMIDVYPQLSDAKIDYVWGGTLDFAFDIMPHAGQLDGMYYAVGYAGHGVAMATYQGQKVAELMAAERMPDDLKARRAEDKPENPFVGIPFPGAPLGLYNGKPWFLPLAGVWYKFLDWVS